MTTTYSSFLTPTIVLYANAATLPGTGSVSVAAWESGDATNAYPRHVQLKWTNNGASTLLIGSDVDGPAVLVADGVDVGPLFNGLRIALTAGASVWTAAPVDAALLGQGWAIRATLSTTGTPSVSVEAHALGIDSDSTTAAMIAAGVLDALLVDHVAIGSVGEGIALAAGLLQGNFFMDQVDNTGPNGQTAARIRLFHNGTAAGAATAGGSGEGEFATYQVTTQYEGAGKITTHRVVRTDDVVHS